MFDQFREPIGFEAVLLNFALRHFIAESEVCISAHTYKDHSTILVIPFVHPTKMYVSVFYDLTNEKTPCSVAECPKDCTHRWPPLFARAMVCSLLDSSQRPEIAVLKSYRDSNFGEALDAQIVDLPTVAQVDRVLKSRILGCGKRNQFADLVAYENLNY